MSNVKYVVIEGQVPFDFWYKQGIHSILAMLSGPSIGLNFTHSQNPVGTEPNSYGGATSIYDFAVKGSEAISIEGIREILQAFVNVGAHIENVEVRDEENDSAIDIQVPQSTKDTQFIYELVIQIEDAGPEAFADPIHQVKLKEYLDEALIVDLSESSGGLDQWLEEAHENTTISLALGRLAPRW